MTFALRARESAHALGKLQNFTSLPRNKHSTQERPQPPESRTLPTYTPSAERTHINTSLLSSAAAGAPEIRRQHRRAKAVPRKRNTRRTGGRIEKVDDTRGGPHGSVVCCRVSCRVTCRRAQRVLSSASSSCSDFSTRVHGAQNRHDKRARAGHARADLGEMRAWKRACFTAVCRNIYVKTYGIYAHMRSRRFRPFS